MSQLFSGKDKSTHWADVKYHVPTYCMGLFQGDFVDTTLVAAAFKIGVEEYFYHCQGFVVGHETAGHGDEISIVVLTRK